MIAENGPSIVFLPSPRLGRNNLGKASEQLGLLATTLGISNRELRDSARTAVVHELEERGEKTRFAGVIE